MKRDSIVDYYSDEEVDELVQEKEDVDFLEEPSNFHLKESRNLDEITEEDEDSESANDKDTILVEKYVCQVCGCQYASTSGIVACVMCGSKNVVGDDHQNVSSYYSLPFVDTINDAISNYRHKIIWNPFIPWIFKKSKTIHRIQKVYIPCIWYDLDVCGDISFLGTEKVKGVNSIPNPTFAVSYSVKVPFPKILLCTYSKITDELFSNINDYNLSVLNPVDSSTISDYYFMCPDENDEDNYQKIKDRLMKYTVNMVRADVPHSLKKLNKNQMEVVANSAKRIFVPAYVLDVRYKNKDYVYVMNAHSGKSIAEYALSPLAIIIFSVVVFAILFLLLFLFTFLF